MEGKEPMAVITDGHRAMRLASQEVFPEAHHRLCAWHLLKNAIVNVCKPHFTTLLRNCMLSNVEVEKFERQWEAMMDECGVWEVEWVKDLYGKKMSWAIAYICGYFYAGLRTTSRCESLHAKIGRFVERRYGILEFMTNFQRCVDFLMDNEEELVFRSLYGSPVLQTQFPELEKSVLVQLDIDCLPKSMGDVNAVYKVRVDAFLPHCKWLARVACMRENDFKSYLEKIVKETTFLKMKSGLRTTGRCNVDGAEEGARDPITVWTKGTGRAQEPFGCRERKRRKCNTCREVGHRRIHCLSSPPSQPTCSQDPAEDIILHNKSQSHGPVVSNENQSQRGSKTVRVSATRLNDA
ncbi:hypothetical protein AHAS_Ahas01G0104500 [Arachis hypogaea]